MGFSKREIMHELELYADDINESDFDGLCVADCIAVDDYIDRTRRYYDQERAEEELFF